MQLALQGRVALVMAASSGLGRATAHRLAMEGARVALCSRRASTIEQVAQEIAATTGAETLGIAADVTRAADIDHAVATVEAALGPPLIVVTNCGGPPTGSLLQFSDEDWRSAFDLILLSAVRVTRRVAAGMRAARWGRIVHIASIAAKQPLDHLGLSNTFRAALLGYAKTASNELAAEGITVNVVCPGPFATRRAAELTGSSAGLATPIAREGRPEELADVIAFLCSELASFVTGTAISVDGGANRGLL